MQDHEQHVSTIFLSTADAQFNANDGEFTIPLKSSLTAGKNTLRIAMESIYFMNSNYTVNKYYNTISLELLTVGFYTLTVPEGNYTSKSLATELANVLNNLPDPSVWTVTYDEVTQKMTIANDTKNFELLPVANSIYPLLGWEEDTLPVGSSLSKTGDGIVDVSGSKYLDIIFNTSPNNHSTNALPVFVRVPILYPFGYYIYYNEENLNYQRVTSETMDNFYVRILDDRKKPYPLASNTHFALQLRVDLTQ